MELEAIPANALSGDSMKATVRLAAIALLGLAASAGAQVRSGMQFNVAAGASFPTGDFGQGADVGYALAAGLGARQAGSPLAFRVEGMYTEWNLSRADVKVHSGGVTANAIYELGTPSTNPGNSVYGIGGLGYYGSGGTTDLGWNIGGGFRFPLSGFSAYFEARYHNISDVNRTFVPVVFGLVF
jgi:hypothetical protein